MTKPHSARPRDFAGTVVYNSSTFIVVAYGHDRIGEEFEIARKDATPPRGVFFSRAGAGAALIRAKCVKWAAETPDAEEVERFLDGMTQLGLLPVVVH